MSAIRTFTVTVANPGSGNKYYIDDVLQDTINLAEGYTYVFNYPSAHPFRFSTTDDGTHNGGSEYTTGVTVNSSTQVQITVAASAPTLYYYCSIHSGMGGQANTVLSNTWGVLQWGQNKWSDQDSIEVTLSGLSVTSSLGTLLPFNETGWGRDTWGFENWGESGIDAILTGLSATCSVGALTTEIKPGWGTLDWGENGWGTVDSAVFNLTGLSATASVGVLTAEDVVGLPALSATSAIGSLTVFSNHTLVLPALSLTSSPGLLEVDDHSVGLSGLSATSAVGSISPADVMGITAPSAAQTAVGSILISSNPVHLLTGVSATTAIGSLTISNITGAALTGQSASTALGTLTTTQLSIASLVGLGQVATSAVGEVIVLGYQDIDIIGNTSYSAVNKTNGASYSDVDVVGNTSYTDVTRVVQEKKIMASTYTDLGLELMATGENAGTWGTKTNANLSLIEQLTGGFNSQAVTDSGTPTALTIADGALTGTAQQRVIELTGSISGSRVVTFPLLTENFYFIKNSTSGAQTVQLKAASGSGATVTFATGNKGWKVIYLDGVATNTGVYEVEIDTVATPAGSDTQVQFNNSGAFGASANLVFDGNHLTIAAEGDLRLGDNTGGEYVGIDAPATVGASYTVTLPAAVGSASQALVTSDGSGNTQWTSTSTFGISTGKAIAMAIVFG